MTPKEKSYENVAATIIKNLEKRQMEGYYCPDSKSAAEKAISIMEKGSVVSYGSSVTLEETGIKEVIRKENYKFLDRYKFEGSQKRREIDLQSFHADYYLMSTNAITLEGELINIDGNGNRVAALIYGPKNVIILAGMNKIVTDVKSGYARVRNFASPPNAVRLNRKTPCAATGKCQDCYSPDCFCNQIVVTRRSGMDKRIKVILIGEELGY